MEFVLPVLIAIAAAAAVGFVFFVRKKKTAPSIPAVQTPAAWTFMYGANETGTPENFTFPARDGVHYCLKKASGVALGKTIRFVFELTGDGELKVADPNDTAPATVRLILQRRNDTLSGADHRFWFDTMINLVNGRFELVAPIDAGRWTNVYGQKSSAGFQALVNDIANYGFTFGGQSFAGHGVYCPTGERKFRLIEYSVV